MNGLPKAANRAVAFLLFLIFGISLPALSGLLVFPFSLIPSNMDVMYRLTLSILFLFFVLFSYKSERWKKYRKVFFSFFIASFAINLQATGALLNLQTTTINSIVLSMLLSTIMVTVPVIVLTLISGEGAPSIFLKRGDFKLSLTIGVAGFIVFAVLSIPGATYLFQGKNLSLERVIAWAPWILATVLLNGVREELLYRGLFLKKYEPLLGSIPTNILQALIFSLSHTVAGRGTIAYTPFTAAFSLITFLLGLVFGYVMQRTDSLLGPILIHAGSDIPVFIGIFSNL